MIWPNKLAEAEDAKVGIRNERKYANNEIKALDISEDLKKNLEVDIQALTDKHIQKNRSDFQQ